MNVDALRFAAGTRSFLLIGQDRKTNKAIVLMGTWAEFTRMCNGVHLPGEQKEGDQAQG